jgi:hypothetical protein
MKTEKVNRDHDQLQYADNGRFDGIEIEIVKQHGPIEEQLRAAPISREIIPSHADQLQRQPKLSRHDLL